MFDNSWSMAPGTYGSGDVGRMSEMKVLSEGIYGALMSTGSKEFHAKALNHGNLFDKVGPDRLNSMGSLSTFVDTLESQMQNNGKGGGTKLCPVVQPDIQAYWDQIRKFHASGTLKTTTPTPLCLPIFTDGCFQDKDQVYELMVLCAFLKFCYERQHTPESAIGVFWTIAQIGDPHHFNTGLDAYNNNPTILKTDKDAYIAEAKKVIKMLNEMDDQLKPKSIGLLEGILNKSVIQSTNFSLNLFEREKIPEYVNKLKASTGPGLPDEYDLVDTTPLDEERIDAGQLQPNRTNTDFLKMLFGASHLELDRLPTGSTMYD